MFKNRIQAAQKLALALDKYRNEHCLVIAIPRGAVPMGRVLAGALGAELDVVLVHKLGHPMNPEYAIGSIDESGRVYAEQPVPQKEIDVQLETLQKRRKLYTPDRTRISPANRTVILVDDGIATGWTLKAAIEAIRPENPSKIIVAAPVGSPDSVQELKSLADEVVCLEQPTDFAAVGQFYNEFSQVTDDEVRKALVQ